MKKIRAGIIGMGFIGVSHIEAIRRIGFAELVAVADTNYDLAKKKAEEYNIPKCYDSIDDLLADPEVDVVHNCTPNFLHLEVNEKIIKAGKHIFSEKPLARFSSESAQMLELLKQYPDTVAGVNFNYRMNPLVREMKQKYINGEIGAAKLAHGTYLQDFLLYDTDYNWRIEPEICGPSRCIADIGSHWMDSVQTVLGAKITKVCADLVITHPIRKKPKGQVETFSLNTNAEYEEKVVKTEDWGAVLFEMDNGVHGVFYVSEVSAGHGCGLMVEINGTKGSMKWEQERADEMWMGWRDGPNYSVKRNPNHMTPEARQYTYLAGGHPEGWNDAFRNNIYAFYKFIGEGKKMGVDTPDFATFEEGHYILKLTEAIVESSKTRQWVNID